MNRFKLYENRVDSGGRWFGELESTIEANDAHDALAIYAERFGEPIAVHPGTNPSENLVKVFYVENGNDPFKLYVSATLLK